MDDWTGKRVLIIGAARQGIALSKYLVSHGARVVLNDRRPLRAMDEARKALNDYPVEWAADGHPLSLLERIDLVCPSGGIPLDIPILIEAKNRGIQFSNDSQIFLEQAPCPVIGITGSAGKTTTTTLVGRMVEAAERPNGIRKGWIGGNIGNPLISILDEVKFDDLAVMELSSFQLDLMTRSPHVSAVLNVTPNHLDRHGTMEAYTRAKKRILDFQQTNDIAVLNREDSGAWALAESVSGSLITFGTRPNSFEAARLPKRSLFPPKDVTLLEGEVVLRDENATYRIMPLSTIGLRGAHNLQNVLAACAIAVAAGLPFKAMVRGVDGFRGVEHRLEYVRTLRGAAWFNDSIATAPERAIAGMQAFEEPIVLLAGGRDKDLPWEDFAAEICARVKHLIAFGEVAQMIVDRVNASAEKNRPDSIVVCKGLQEAVKAAANVATHGDIVLLSPGGTSFDEFHDFAARGREFKKMIMEIGE